MQISKSFASILGYERGVREKTWICKIILLGIVSKGCLAETSSKPGRHRNHDEEIASLLLSVKLALGSPTALVVIRVALEDRSSIPSSRSSRRRE